MAITNCKHFNGYKPCSLSTDCSKQCGFLQPVQERIIVVHLEALGAVLRATSILAGIKRKYPNSQITWVTQAPAQALLMNLVEIDRVLTASSDDLLLLNSLKFDFGFCLDKSLKAAGVLANTKVNNIKGFVANEIGAIIPANSEAVELWELGLSDHKKFFVNKKPETQLLIESLNLGAYRQDNYRVELSPSEKKVASGRRSCWANKGEVIVGLNTGCSPTIPYKKLSQQYHRELIIRLEKIKSIKIVLLGGPEDTERNSIIAKDFDNVIISPTEKGLRDGFASVEACDLVVSGDSLGMHMAIGLKKYVIAWFGPTCAHEIELYGRGERVLSHANCSPCWRRSCQKTVMCYDLVNIDELVSAVKRGIECQTSSYKQPLSGIYSSQFPA